MGKWVKLGISVIAVAILSITIVSTSAEESLIPSWIKNTAGWWANDQIQENDFLFALQYLTQNQIIKVKPTKLSEDISETSKKYLLPKGRESITLPFEYDFPDHVVGKGISVYQNSPDGTTRGIEVEIDKLTGHFSGIIEINSESLIGTHSINARSSGNDIPLFSYKVTNQEIPKWIKTNAGWWSDGQISDDDFMRGIEYLIESGIIYFEIPNQDLSPEARTIYVEPLETFLPKESFHRTLFKITEDSDRYHSAIEDTIHAWFLEDGILHDVYLYRFNTIENAKDYFAGIMLLSKIDMESSFSIECGYYSIKLNRFDTSGGWMCLYNNILVNVYTSADVSDSSPLISLASLTMDEVLNNIINYLTDIDDESFTALDTKSEQFESVDSGNELFEIEIVSCELTGTGNYIEVSFGIKNNLDQDYTLDLQFLQIDLSGDVIEVERHYMDTKAGRTIYDSILMDYEVGVLQCLIEIVDSYPTYP